MIPDHALMVRQAHRGGAFGERTLQLSCKKKEALSPREFKGPWIEDRAFNFKFLRLKDKNNFQSHPVLDNLGILYSHPKFNDPHSGDAP